MFRFLSLLVCCLLATLPVRAQIQWADEDGEAQTDIAFDLRSATAGQTQLRFAAHDDQNFFALDCTPTTIALRRVIAGQSTLLTSANHQWKAQQRVVMQRRSWLLRVIVDQRVVLTAYDDSLADGRIGTQNSGGWQAGEMRVQPVETIDFADDFTRENGQNGEWTGSEAWRISASSDGISARNAQMSANPFGLEIATPHAQSWTRAGRWFWDNYQAEVSVRPEGTRGEMSLCVYVQDERNYLAFRWNSNPKNARRLVRVVEGQETVLATSDGAWYPNQWYRLAVRTAPDATEVFLDGERLFTTRDHWFAQGGIALSANRFSRIAFDDVRVRSHEIYRAAFDDNQTIAPASGWNSRGGSWQSKDDTIVSRAQSGAIGSRYLLSGRDDWRDYAISAQGKVGARGALGVIIGFRDEKNYTLLRWAGAQSALPFRGRRQILRYQNGKAIIERDEALGDLSANAGWAAVRVQRQDGALKIYANEQLIAQIAESENAGGRCGLWAQGADAAFFREVKIDFPMPVEAPQRPPEKMEGDALMVGWASPTGEWPTRQKDGRTELWNTGEFFGPTQFELDWQPKVHGKGTIELALGARDEFASGLIVQLKADATNLHATLLRDGQTLAQGAIALQDEPLKLRVTLENHALAVTASAQTLLLWNGELPKGTHLAARADVPLNAESLRATSAGRDDYTFSSAPVDWYSPSGNWSVLSRWPCYSDWSFFGGAGLNPVLWNKRVYGGDTIVEIYAHNQMDLPKELGYSHAGDLNLTLCGDGISPAAGYAFVLAGWDNTRSRLLKNGKILAENEGENGRFPRAINANLEYHKRWFYLRASARRATRDGVNGVQLQLSVDNELVLNAFDPDPLPSFDSGRVGIWTLDGTMMIARAKIESQKSGGKYLPPALSAFANTLRVSNADRPEDDGTLTPQPLHWNDENGALITRTPPTSGENGATWHLINPTPGGAFGAQWRDAQTGSWTVNENARLTGEIAIPDGSKIDFYVVIDGELFLLETAGAQTPDAAAPSLGRMSLTPTNQKTAEGTRWMKLEFALGAALKKRFPQAHSWRIEALQSGALHGARYRWSGFDGNALGAAFAVRGLRWNTK